VVVDHLEGEFGWGVAGGADHMDHEPVDQGVQAGRLALGVDLRRQPDLGVVTHRLESWCTVEFHKSLGMILHVRIARPSASEA
jgi:hypothetical protein